MDVSSLADLKAEVVRKRNEAKLNKAHGRDKKSSPEKSKPLWAVKEKKVDPKLTSKGKVDPEEERRVHTALEMKARLYNQMKSGQLEDVDGKYLINFNQNKNDDSDSSDNEKFPELLSEDGRREILRQKWEKEEEENMKKTDIHYNDVLFDEARTHGAAFYSFSRDEATRAKELDELKKMHEQTQKERENKEKTKKDRKSALQSRLKKVRDRKRLKLGLPMLDSDEETEAKQDEGEASKEDLNDSVLKALKDIREKEEEAKRKLVIRDWDVGKKESPILNIKPSERKVMDQNEWVQAKRSERPTEFAPPVNLYKDQESGPTVAKRFNSVPPPAVNQGYPQPVRTKLSPKSKQSLRANVSTVKQSSHTSRPGTSHSTFNHMPPPAYTQPPQSYNFGSVPPPGYQQPHSQSSNFKTAPPGYPPLQSSNFSSVPPPGYKTENKNKSTNVQPMGYTDFHSQQKFLKNVVGSSQSKCSSFETMYEVPEDAEERRAPEKVVSSSLSKSSRLELHKQMAGGQQSFRPIVNELEDHLSEEDLEPEPVSNRVGTSVEIPPPCDMDYYATTSVKRSNWQGMRTRDELSEAFSFGMSQLKKKQKKEESNDEEED